MQNTTSQLRKNCSSSKIPWNLIFEKNLFQEIYKITIVGFTDNKKVRLQANSRVLGRKIQICECLCEFLKKFEIMKILCLFD